MQAYPSQQPKITTSVIIARKLRWTRGSLMGRSCKLSPLSDPLRLGWLIGHPMRRMADLPPATLVLTLSPGGELGRQLANPLCLCGITFSLPMGSTVEEAAFVLF